MVVDNETTGDGLVGQFLDALQKIPDVRVVSHEREARESSPNSRSRYSRNYDAVVDIEVDGRGLRLIIEVKKSAYPRDVRELAWRSRDQTTALQKNHDDVPMLVTAALSPGAKDLLRHERIGYYDTGGSLYLPARGVYLFIDKPPPKSFTRIIRSLFSGRRAQLLHSLLVQPRTWVGANDLAKSALVSATTASETLIELERLDWVESRGQGPAKERRLSAPADLLDAWVKHVTSLRLPTRRYFVSSAGIDDLVDRIAHEFEERDIEYAVTHEAAAQRYAKFLSNVSRVHCRVMTDESVDAALQALDARHVTDGANLILIDVKSRGDLLFRQRIGAAWLASPVQTYLDLVRGEGRSKELAEHLRHERIGF